MAAFVGFVAVDADGIAAGAAVVVGDVAVVVAAAGLAWSLAPLLEWLQTQLVPSSCECVSVWFRRRPLELQELHATAFVDQTNFPGLFVAAVLATTTMTGVA